LFCYEVERWSLRWRCHLDSSVTGDPAAVPFVTQPTFSSDGRHVLCGARHGRVVIVDAQNGTWVATQALGTDHRVEWLERCPGTGQVWALADPQGPPIRVSA
jgi:hypothetical protein